MTLFIDTTGKQEINIALQEENKKLVSKTIKADRNQAEKLLPLIDKLLTKNNYHLAQLTEIKVVSKGGSFTSLRIGVLTANALGYALGIPVLSANDNKKKIKHFGRYNIVEPEYEIEPNIGIKKNTL